jgi:hypothetical protein
MRPMERMIRGQEEKRTSLGYGARICGDDGSHMCLVIAVSSWRLDIAIPGRRRSACGRSAGRLDDDGAANPARQDRFRSLPQHGAAGGLNLGRRISAGCEGNDWPSAGDPSQHDAGVHRGQRTRLRRRAPGDPRSPIRLKELVQQCLKSLTATIVIRPLGVERPEIRLSELSFAEPSVLIVPHQVSDVVHCHTEISHKLILPGAPTATVAHLKNCGPHQTKVSPHFSIRGVRHRAGIAHDHKLQIPKVTFAGETQRSQLVSKVRSARCS